MMSTRGRDHGQRRLQATAQSSSLSSATAEPNAALLYAKSASSVRPPREARPRGEVRNFRTVERRNVEQSVKIETMRAELKERDDGRLRCRRDELETCETRAREASEHGRARTYSWRSRPASPRNRRVRASVSRARAAVTRRS